MEDVVDLVGITTFDSGSRKTRPHKRRATLPIFEKFDHKGLASYDHRLLFLRGQQCWIQHSLLGRPTADPFKVIRNIIALPNSTYGRRYVNAEVYLSTTDLMMFQLVTGNNLRSFEIPMEGDVNALMLAKTDELHRGIRQKFLGL